MIKETLETLLTTTKKISVLYVEDNDSARENTLGVLEEFFSSVTIAKDGNEGLRLFGKSKFDLIITDINMPVMNGLEMIAAIRELDRELPILVLSAYDDTHYFLETIKLGVEGYLLKPIDMNQFIDLLTRITRNIKERQENRDYKKNLEQRVLEKTRAVRYSYSHDLISGLPNSVKLDEALRSKKYRYYILLDISDFTLIVKEYGRSFANETLQAVAQNLTYHADDYTPLFKVESDRFVFLSSEDETIAIKSFCDRIYNYFREINISVRDSELNIDFYIAVTKITPESNPIIDAEYAMEDCKRGAAVGTCHLYKADRARVVDELEMIRWLKITKHMIMDEMIEPYFQPIKEIETDKILKYEVLARGMVDGEVISPEHFLIPAERLGLTSNITKIMVEKSFDFFQHNALDFSINISERDLIEGYLVAYMRTILEKYDIDAQRVTFEVLENIATRKNNKVIIEQIKALQAIGLQIAVDDFGVEHSNFRRLLDIDIDVIKIDGEFIKRIGHDEKGKKIVRAIVSLAQTLGVKTVAEYVESEEIYNIVKECGIDFAQGYHVGRPRHTLLERHINAS